MKLPDVNLLLYAFDAAAPRHDEARRWLEERLSGVETFALAWVVVLAYGSSPADGCSETRWRHARRSTSSTAGSRSHARRSLIQQTGIWLGFAISSSHWALQATSPPMHIWQR